MFYSTLFLICSRIPPTGAKTNVFGSNTTGIGVFLLTLSWYFDRRDTNPTLVCISPNRIPVKISNSVFRMGASPVVILCMYCSWNHRLEPIKITDIFIFSTQIWDYDWLQKTSITLMSFWINSFTPLNRAVYKKRLVAQLINKFLAFDRTQKSKKFSTSEYSCTCSVPNKNYMTLVIFV